MPQRPWKVSLRGGCAPPDVRPHQALIHVDPLRLGRRRHYEGHHQQQRHKRNRSSKGTGLCGHKHWQGEGAWPSASLASAVIDHMFALRPGKDSGHDQNPFHCQKAPILRVHSALKYSKPQKGLKIHLKISCTKATSASESRKKPQHATKEGILAILFSHVQ